MIGGMGAGLERYRLGPFLIESELPFPELPQDRFGEPNAWIRLGTAPARIEGVVANESQWWASPTEYLQRVPGVATFHVSHGRTIVVEPAPESLAGDIRAYLLAPIFTSLCFQNRMYALHASSVQVGGGVVAFLGDSGAGKSTLAAYLERRGYPVVSDDFCLLAPSPGQGSGPVVIPVAPAVKLWRSALEVLGGSPDELPRVWSREDKYRLRLCEARERLPLRELYCLEWAPDDEGASFAEISGSEAVTRLMGFTHFEYVMKPMGRLQESFLLAGRILQSVPVFVLRRPKSFSRMEGVVDAVEQRLLALGQRQEQVAAGAGG